MIRDRMAYEITDDDGFASELRPTPQMLDNPFIREMVQDLRCHNEIKRPGQKRRRAGISLNNRDSRRIVCPTGGDSRCHRIGLKPDNIRVDPHPFTPSQNGRRNIRAPRPDIEQRKVLELLPTKSPAQAEHDAPAAAKITIQETQIT